MSVRFKNPIEEREARATRRLQIFYVSLSLGYFIVIGRAVFLMLQDNQKLEEIAMSQYRAAIQNETYRHRILDRKGKELAISIPAWSIYADPREVKNKRGTASLLAKWLREDPYKLRQKLSEKRKFVWIKRRISNEMMEKIGRLKLEGIYGLKENMRFYPHGSLAANVLGTVGVDSQALGGIEMAYDPYLMVTPKSAIYLRDARGRLYRPPQTLERIQGKGDVYLTIDKNLQYFAEQELQQAVSKHQAKAGILVMMDPTTGGILAMANFPTFDPNRQGVADWESWRSRAVTDIYEPGSTFKIVVVGGALEEKRITLKEKFDCEGGSYALPHSQQVIHDSKPHNKLNVADIIQVSSNICSYKIGQRLGKGLFFKRIQLFGFGQKTGLDFPGEATGLVRPPSKWRPIETGTIAFGHGIGATPLQILSAYSALANGGMQMKPHLVEKVVGSEGEIQYQAIPEERGRPLLPETAAFLKQMLTRVVEEGGTATEAAMEEYQVAGKTGTAWKVDPNGRGYLEGKYISSFIGFAPVENPRLVTLVLLDEPKGSYYGGVVAAPVFREVMRRSLAYLQLPPHGQKKEFPLAEKGTEFPLPHERGFVRMTREGSLVEVPNFQGASMREVLQAMEDLPFEIAFQGRGAAVEQQPGAGYRVKAGSKIVVKFAPLYP